MSEMIKRVAKRVCAFHARFLAASGQLPAAGLDWRDFVGHAHEAMVAMREPTEAMIEAGAKKMWESNHPELRGELWPEYEVKYGGKAFKVEVARGYLRSAQIYHRAMIDEALK